MDSFELNKIAGAVLGTMLVVFGIGIIGDMIFATEEPETPGYVIAVAEEPAGDGAETAAATEEPIAVLLANADPAAGEASARKCASCHTFEQGGANRVGPNLYDVVERQIASIEGFSYSDALQAHAQEAGTWSFDELNAFIASPRQAVPGTTMGFAGINNPEERADLLVYLRELSPDPVPLPEAPAGADAMAGAEPGEIPEGAEPPQPAAESAEPSGEVPDEGLPAGEESAEPQQQAQPEQQGQDQQAQQPEEQGQDQQAQAGEETVLVVPPAGEAGAQQEQADQPQQQGQAGQAQQAQQAPAEPAADLPPALALMSEVDVEDGRAEARKCQACHALEEGGGNRVGPPLWGIVDRPIAAQEGYSYSQALTEFGEGKQWDFSLLDAFVQAPQQLVPGTKMVFPGIRNERDRAELLVFLNSLSAQPAPLPGGAGEGAPAQAQ